MHLDSDFDMNVVNSSERLVTMMSDTNDLIQKAYVTIENVENAVKE